MILNGDPEQRSKGGGGMEGAGEGESGGEGGEDEFTSPRYGERVSKKMQKRSQWEKKNLIQIIFTLWALKCKSQIKEGWNGK